MTHVAIYTGNNEYINASGIVRINSLDTTKTNYKKKSLISVKRVIGVEDNNGIVSVKKHKLY